MKESLVCSYLFLHLLLCSVGTSQGFKLRIAQFDVSSKWSSGMDGGLGGILTFGGGEFRIKICNALSRICCETLKPLETMNNDWEVSEINFFIGDDLQDCENHFMEGRMEVTLIHEGYDGGRIKDIHFYGSDFGYGKHHRREYICPIYEKLDGYTRKTVDCVYRSPIYNSTRSCNGDERFCDVPYNNYTFLGAHNAGTGEDASSITQINCAFKNHDLDIKEQLDFGIRFFDFDVIQSKKLYNCDGLETGHGRYPGLGIYRCFGSMERIIHQLLIWLEETGHRDVVTLYFGAIDFEESTSSALRSLFSVPHIQRRLNGGIKGNDGVWPTLGVAIGEGKNIFVFMRTSKPISEPFLIREVPHDKVEETEVLCEEDVIITSTFKSGHVGKDCQIALENAERFCQYDGGELLKLAMFGQGFSESLCLWESARRCNPRLNDVLETCQSLSGGTVNFVQMDFPNYLGNGGSIPIDTLMDFNTQRHFT